MIAYRIEDQHWNRCKIRIKLREASYTFQNARPTEDITVYNVIPVIAGVCFRIRANLYQEHR